MEKNNIYSLPFPSFSLSFLLLSSPSNPDMVPFFPFYIFCPYFCLRREAKRKNNVIFSRVIPLLTFFFLSRELCEKGRCYRNWKKAFPPSPLHWLHQINLPLDRGKREGGEGEEAAKNPFYLHMRLSQKRGGGWRKKRWMDNGYSFFPEVWIRGRKERIGTPSFFPFSSSSFSLTTGCLKEKEVFL